MGAQGPSASCSKENLPFFLSSLHGHHLKLSADGTSSRSNTKANGLVAKTTAPPTPTERPFGLGMDSALSIPSLSFCFCFVSGKSLR